MNKQHLVFITICQVQTSMGFPYSMGTSQFPTKEKMSWGSLVVVPQFQVQG